MKVRVAFKRALRAFFFLFLIASELIFYQRTQKPKKVKRLQQLTRGATCIRATTMMHISVNYKFEPSQKNSFCAEIQIFVPVNREDMIDHDFISPNVGVYDGRLTELKEQKYRLLEETIYSTSWEELDKLINKRIEELGNYRNWVRSTRLTVPSSKHFVIQ